MSIESIATDVDIYRILTNITTFTSDLFTSGRDDFQYFRHLCYENIEYQFSISIMQNILTQRQHRTRGLSLLKPPN